MADMAERISYEDPYESSLDGSFTREDSINFLHSEHDPVNTVEVNQEALRQRSEPSEQRIPEPAQPVERAPMPVASSTPAPEFHFSSKAEADEALERLRMRYIAGELTREDYYNEKTLIERASAALPGG